MQLNPWHPMMDSVALKHLGKLGEEAGELCSAANRCIIQGINECEPVTYKPNKQWLQDEIADVFANSELCIEHFGLDREYIRGRIAMKIGHLRDWHKFA